MEWEYQVTAIYPESESDCETDLNGRGSEGWELVWVHTGRFEYIAVFKRPKKTEQNKPEIEPGL